MYGVHAVILVIMITFVERLGSKSKARRQPRQAKSIAVFVF